MSSETLEPPPERTSREDVASVRVLSVAGESARERLDWLAVEEPLEIRAHGPGETPSSIAVTMRTPGHDAELAVGFLATEGFISRPSDVVSVGRDEGTQNSQSNIVVVELSHPFDDARLKRNFYATSSCGICGKASLERVSVQCSPVPRGLQVDRKVILDLPKRLRAAQAAFERTGGLHAAGLFDVHADTFIAREDIGRHNAVDKLVGRSLLDGALPLSRHILMVSGRTSFEVLQKAAVAGISIVCAVSAPSSLAVSLADELGITLVGFLRGDGFNVYTHYDRIDTISGDRGVE